jgi:hypothetical protein
MTMLEYSKKAIRFVIRIVKMVEDFSKEQGGIDWKNLPKLFLRLIVLIPDMFNFIGNLGKVAGELNNLTDKKRDELYYFVKEEFDLDDDKVEKVTEKAIMAIMAIYQIYKEL